jgi:hypothetical protein
MSSPSEVVSTLPDELRQLGEVLRSQATQMEGAIDTLRQLSNLPQTFGTLVGAAESLANECHSIVAGQHDWLTQPLLESIRTVESTARFALGRLDPAAFDRLEENALAACTEARTGAGQLATNVAPTVHELSNSIRQVAGLFSGSESVVAVLLEGFEDGFEEIGASFQDIVEDSGERILGAFEQAVADLDLEFDQLVSSIDEARDALDSLLTTLSDARDALSAGEENAQGALQVATDIVRNTQDCIQQIL